MTHYFLINEQNIIIDAIQYEVEGYTVLELNETHLPVGINAGWYRLTDTGYEFDQQLFDTLNTP